MPGTAAGAAAPAGSAGWVPGGEGDVESSPWVGSSPWAGSSPWVGASPIGGGAAGAPAGWEQQHSGSAADYSTNGAGLPHDHAPARTIPDVPHPAEAGALGAAFAADYLSWDEDDPDRRARVLGEYLAVRRPVQLGWSGQGRQRADFALPGVVRPDGDGRVLVDVRVRVTPYVRVPGGRHGPPDAPFDGPAAPSSAPAPAARGWRGLPGHWVRISVAVVVAGERLVVDAEEEADEPWATPDPDLADDLPEESP